MQVLLVEDNAFNAFCLIRLLQSVQARIQVSVVNNSICAMDFLVHNTPAMIIMDGFLQADDPLHRNGPLLTDMIWSTWPDITVIAWTDSELMRRDFTGVFSRHDKRFHEDFLWPKVVSRLRIKQTLEQLVDPVPCEYLPNSNQVSVGCRF